MDRVAGACRAAFQWAIPQQGSRPRSVRSRPRPTQGSPNKIKQARGIWGPSMSSSWRQLFAAGAMLIGYFILQKLCGRSKSVTTHLMTEPSAKPCSRRAWSRLSKWHCAIILIILKSTTWRRSWGWPRWRSWMGPPSTRRCIWSLGAMTLTIWISGNGSLCCTPLATRHMKHWQLCDWCWKRKSAPSCSPGCLTCTWSGPCVLAKSHQKQDHQEIGWRRKRASVGKGQMPISFMPRIALLKSYLHWVAGTFWPTCRDWKVNILWLSLVESTIFGTSSTRSRCLAERPPTQEWAIKTLSVFCTTKTAATPRRQRWQPSWTTCWVASLCYWPMRLGRKMMPSCNGFWSNAALFWIALLLLRFLHFWTPAMWQALKGLDARGC